jgi:tRNA pseudouridine synthase 10
LQFLVLFSPPLKDIWPRYVKEFVHGDLGRTNPNFGSLLNCTADILQLDVLDIALDFPPLKLE